MKRTLVVLALAVLSSAGCRAMNPSRGPGCGSGCGEACCEPSHVTRTKHAPRPVSCGETCHSNLEQECPGGNGCLFDRYCGHNCGHNCGPGYHPGPYDCSPCDSPHWGCTGHRHPHGYVDGNRCFCQGQVPGHCPQPGPHCPLCGHGYCCTCCGPPAPGCECCPCCGCGPSGDHNYTFNPGPPTGQTAYPYYTLRGPRDFLLDNPPPLGPY
jgi:hypothetical protein